ncbi:MAG: DNA repair protein RecN [Bryobacteraceae bacterium]|nr:DNA repair protein RecN [Bryobacteraceae bacterium]
MLVELTVANYAVVERARVRFHAGLNVLTGETGSGKSLLVDALALLFGGRASSDMLRSGSDRARVSAIFETGDSPPLRKLLDGAGIDSEEGELLLEREILANGKSRAFAGSRPVTVALLRDLAPLLGDIHGQHDQQLLFSPAAQREILDAFARCEALVAEIGGLFERWQAVSAELAGLDRAEQERLRLVDLWQFQRKEIEAVNPRPGEEDELEAERRVLRNVTRLEESASAAYSALYDAPDSAASQLKTALRKLEDLARIDPAIEETLAAIRPAAISVSEAAHSLRDYLARLEADPARLETVENRLAAIGKLKRKYGSTVAGILDFLHEVTDNLNAVENAAGHRAALEEQRNRLAEEYRVASGKLSAKRREGARQLARKVEAELAALAMERSVFVVHVGDAPWSEHGVDSIAFLVSANVGEEPRPLDKIVSGGELSRIALALKTAAPVRARAPRTLVFDEVDAGVGGAAAEAVGRRLKKLSASHQVLCVTHLAPIASFADHHYAVEKRAVKGRSVAEIEEIQGAARTREIGRMLSGQTLTPEALKHAEHLIRLGQSA